MATDRIRTYNFSTAGLTELSGLARGKDWPVVYMIHNEKDLYIGETTSAATRMAQHLGNKAKREKNLKFIEIVFDDEFNKSVILDYEQKLIKYCRADTRFKNLLNANLGQSASHDYYQRAMYNDKFKDLWEELRRQRLAVKALSAIENENIFKYSPYTSLTEEQNHIAADIIRNIAEAVATDSPGISIVNGCAGTGKSVLAVSMINSLVNVRAIGDEDLELTDDDLKSEKVQALMRLDEVLKEKKIDKLKIGFLMPLQGIRKTFQKVFKACGNGLTSKMVVGPCDLTKVDHYDVLFVDEAHRLSTRKNIVNNGGFIKTAEALGFDRDECSQLDWVIKQAKYKVLFYDSDQSVKGSDVSAAQFEKTIDQADCPKKSYQLETQMRCRGGGTFVDYIKDIMNVRNPDFKEINNYVFRLFDDVGQMYSAIRQLDEDMGLCRCVAGYSWKWNTKAKKSKLAETEECKLAETEESEPAETEKRTGSDYDSLVAAGKYDIEIDGHKFIWNMTNEDWINEKHSVDTIGCIHSTQGYDLNFVGVIFGREIDYNPEMDCIEIDPKLLFDTNVKRAVTPDVLKKYIINTYTTILDRGIHGCFVYACNKNLRDYLARFIRMEDSTEYKKGAARLKALREKLIEVFGRDTFTEEELTKEFWVELKISCCDCFRTEDGYFDEAAFQSPKLTEWLLAKDKDYK